LSGPAPTSVIIASHGRPGHLRRCLTALRYQSHPRFEVVVVADRAGLEAIADHPVAESVKRLPFDDEHLARARNVGIAAASGDVLAFLDDDAVPEPTWLERLCRALDRDEAAAAVGAVRGRNGFSLQSRTPWVDRRGVTVDPGDPNAVPATGGAVPKLVGTNMAVRAGILRTFGGFDEAFRFYLEDADLSLRLAGAGHRITFAPEAEVHHAFAASSRRRADRRPLALDGIGRSLAIFLRKHCDEAGIPGALNQARAEQRMRLLRHMVAGTCEPADVGRLLRGFDEGVSDGRIAETDSYPALSADSRLLPFPGLSPSACTHLLAGRPWRADPLRKRAAALAAEGDIATLMLFSPTSLYHRRAFTSEGYWTQTGGVFGRSDRTGKLFQMSALRQRVQREWTSIESVRKPANTTFRTHLSAKSPVEGT
jgi:GT2 family glycosyltransferase